MMERELEVFRRECLMKRRIQRVLLAIQLTLLILSWAVFLGPGKSADAEMGISALLAMIPLTVYIGRLFVGTKALESEAELRKVYIAEQDERTIAIRQRAGIPVVQYMSLMLGIIGAALSFFSGLTVQICGLLLIAVCYVQIGVSVLLRRYWEKRM